MYEYGIYPSLVTHVQEKGDGGGVKGVGVIQTINLHLQMDVYLQESSNNAMHVCEIKRKASTPLHAGPKCNLVSSTLPSTHQNHTVT